MHKDARIPEALEDLQQWFAGMITQPLTLQGNIRAKTPDGGMVAKETAKRITTGPRLRPHQKIELYNRQYWWRLLKSLHENFPLVTRLFGYHSFNTAIAIPYLTACPPDDWSLNSLGTNLCKWLDEKYREPDRKLVLDAAYLDSAFLVSFTAPRYEPLDAAQAGNQEYLLSRTFFLQPHIFLFRRDCDMPAFREAFLKQDVDYWTEHDFPVLAKEKIFYSVLFRSARNLIGISEISAGEYILLNKLRTGSTIEEACVELEKQEESIYEQACLHLQEWIQGWVVRGWLYTK